MDFAFNQLVTLFICIVGLGNCHVNGEKYITVWEHPNFQGVSENLCVSHCSNIRNPRNIKLVSSINLQGNCARFYDEFNCSGKSIEVLPHSAFHNLLGDWNLDDRSRSVGPCRNECAVDVTGNKTEEDVKVQLFNKANYLGNDGTLIGTGCFSIQSSFISQIKSIKTFGQCIELYNNPHCLHSGANMTSVELRQDTYFHNDLLKWKVPSVLSISHCRYKCEEISRRPKNEEVIIFDQVNYTGSWIQVKIGNCTNLPYQWEMGAKSLEFRNGTCAVMYEDFNCGGGSFVLESNTVNLLNTRGNVAIRSIRACPKKTDDSTSSINPVAYFYFAVVVFIVIALVIIFVLGERYGFRMQISLSPPSKKEVTEYEEGSEEEAQNKENNKNCGKIRFAENLVDFSASTPTTRACIKI